MSRSLNKVFLIGHVGRDPEVRTTQNGTKVANTSIATNWGKDGSERTDWHRIVFWSRLAELAGEYMKKGDRAYIEGRIVYDSYEKDGVTIPTVEVHASEMILLSPKSGGAGAGSDAAPDDMDDTPF